MNLIVALLLFFAIEMEVTASELEGIPSAKEEFHHREGTALSNPKESAPSPQEIAPEDFEDPDNSDEEPIEVGGMEPEPGPEPELEKNIKTLPDEMSEMGDD